jgi:hypothetical protein
MSTQEFMKELTKLNRDELALVDLKLHELFQGAVLEPVKSFGSGSIAAILWPRIPTRFQSLY